MSEYELKPILNVGTIELNYEELKATAIAQTAKYKDLVITEKEAKEMKAVRAEMNKIIDRISAKRIEIKKEYNQPVAVMEDKIKEVVNIIGAARDNIDEQLKAFDHTKRQARKQFFETVWDTDQIMGIQFGQVYDPKWENESVGMEEALTMYRNKITRITDDLTYLATLANKQEGVLAIEQYKKVLDLTQALSYARDMMQVLAKANILPTQEPRPFMPADEDPDMILGMKFELKDVKGTKQEYYAINFRSESDYKDALKVLDAVGIPYVK